PYRIASTARASRAGRSGRAAGPAYPSPRRFLEHLQSRRPGGRWVLKSPGHLGPIEALLAEYPDALVVQTHRDPRRVIPSVASLEVALRGAASDAVDPAAVGAQQLRVWSRLLEQGLEAREHHPEHAWRFCDLHFQEIAGAPIACVRRIYAHFDLELRPEVLARMRAHLAAHPRDEHGVHRYSLAMFGLDGEGVAKSFARYRACFGVADEAEQREGRGPMGASGGERGGAGERAWGELLGSLADAAKTITGPTGAADALERAEGFRYLTRLLAAGLEMHLERADPARPSFTRMLSPIRKFLGDNPDVLYEYVPLDGARRYRVRGRRGGELYLAFCVYDRAPDGATRRGANLSDAGMRFEADGSFELHLAPERPAGAANWLRLGPQAASMIARQYFHDPANAAPARLEIEAVPAAPAPPPLAEAEFARRLAAGAPLGRETPGLSPALSLFAGPDPAPRAGGEPRPLPGVGGGGRRGAPAAHGPGRQ